MARRRSELIAGAPLPPAPRGGASAHPAATHPSASAVAWRFQFLPREPGPVARDRTRGGPSARSGCKNRPRSGRRAVRGRRVDQHAGVQHGFRIERTFCGAEHLGEERRSLAVVHVAVQPPDGVLVTVPAAFRSGQPASGLTGAGLSVLGLAVTLDARARWLWSYGDGVTSWSSVPGGRYPNLSVSHAYRRSGSLRVTVSSVWRGSYTVEGIGPFAIPGDPLVQTASITVVVRSAHAHLVG